MLRATKRIIVMSEKVNRYGFRALVDGVDLSYYEANPIMLWMHNRAFGSKEKAFLPLGNVIELKVEEIENVGKCITGQPMFDDTDEFAVSIFNKYENGTLRMASVGLIPVDWSEDEANLVPGQRRATLVKSILEEISMVDIGADSNALAIALYNHDHELVQLSLDGDNAVIPLLKQTKSDMKIIQLSAEKAAVLLGLKETDTPEQYEAKISEVVQLAASQKTQIETLTQEKSDLQTKLDEQVELAAKEKVEAYVEGAEKERKITAAEKPAYIALALNHKDGVEKGFDQLKTLLDAKAATPTIETKLSAGEDESKKDRLAELIKLSYDELFENGGLIELKQLNEAEYNKKLEAKFPKK